MSEPTREAELASTYEDFKRKCAEEAGLQVWGRDNDGELEFYGNSAKWKKFDELLNKWEEGLEEINF